MATKQRRIKPGRDYNFSQGVLCKAEVAISADDLVYVSGYDGATMQVSPADSATVVGSQGLLLVAKHAIPVGEFGVCLPWKVVDADTTAFSADDPVYLGTDTAGSYVADVEANGWWARVVGRVLTSATAGKVLLSPAAPHEYTHGPIGDGGAWAVPRILEFDIAASGGTSVLAGTPYKAQIIDAWFLTTTGGTTENVTLAHGGNTAVTIATGTVSTDDIVRATAIDRTYETVAKAATLTADLSGTTIAGTLFVSVIPSI